MKKKPTKKMMNGGMARRPVGGTMPMKKGGKAVSKMKCGGKVHKGKK